MVPSGGAELCSMGCGLAAWRERCNISIWEREEEASKTEQIQAIASQRTVIQSEECKQFCLEHKFQNLTAILQNPKFPVYMRTCLEIKRLQQTQGAVLGQYDKNDINDLREEAGLLAERADEIKRLRALETDKDSLKRELNILL